MSTQVEGREPAVANRQLLGRCMYLRRQLPHPLSQFDTIKPPHPQFFPGPTPLEVEGR